jgi:hypothetical protein
MMSNKNRVMLAALSIHEQGAQVFSMEHLTVVSWRIYGARFGLDGYESNYPDITKVQNATVGPAGLVTRKLLRYVSSRCYSLTEEGVAYAKLLQKMEDDRARIEGSRAE